MFRSSMLLLLGCVEAQATYNFVSIGDWGGVNLGSYQEVAEKAVAAQLEKTASDLDAKFVINTGDNFYYCGVSNVSDPLFKTDFEDVFTAASTHVPWYSILGNHDYGYAPEAQLQYKSPTNDRWVLPERYYTKRVLLDGTQYLSMVFLDTNPCISAYRSSNPSGWDPCSGKYQDCPLGCKFHDNIIAQNCTAQYDWLRSTMATIPKGDWVIVVGHHAAWEIDTEDFTSVLQQYGFDLYLNGHTHELNTYTVDGEGQYVTTGAGCMVAISNEGRKEADVDAPLAHTHEYTWYDKVAGFTTHSFDASFSTLTTKFLTYNGTVIKTIVSNKRA
eukprot:TRINITY_DN28781_c0_g1_i1.p1 TRINITY_DN28781_c0_g1~~TRINITY_DN28781_c0_g1_i1.p1  ORF type:complete len:342 (+),score=140.38 TRINITY_DN28781_c0_g1_i1:39-1028(+)